jgi:hypothetical protein
MNIKQQTQNVAAQGRYGDNMLLHVNPAEVQGLASVMPLTKNPQTGQPEAFLPFLAPLLGSAAGTALFTGLNPAVAGAIGSGLATAIQSGDLRQGMLAGLTGFGLGKAFNAAGVGEASKAASDAATTGAEVVADAAAEGPVTPTVADVGSTADALAKGGIDAFASQLAKPSSYLPIAMGEGTRGTIQAQEDFEKAMREYELGQKQREEEMYAMYPEQIPMSNPYYYGKEGGIINMEEGKQIPDEERSISLLPGKGRLRKPMQPPRDRLPRDIPPLPPTGSFEAAMSGGLDAYYTPPKQLSGPVTAEAVPVIDPTTGMPMLDAEGNIIPSGQFKPSANYRPGIDPEFNYLPGGNQPFSALGATGGGGTDQAKMASYYGNPMMQQMFGPFGINKPYANNMFDSPINIDLSNLYTQPYTPVNNPIIDPMPPMRDDFMSIDRIGNDPRDPRDTMGMSEYNISNPPPISERIPATGGTGLFGGGLETMPMLMPEPMPIRMPEPMPTMPPVMDTIVSPMPNELSVPFAPPPVAPMPVPPPVPPVSTINNPFMELPTPPMRDDFMSIDRMDNFPFRMEEGKQIPDDAKGLQALAKTEKGKEAVRQMGFELQMGGMTPSPDEIQQLQMAVLGQIPNNDVVISMFIDKYGNEMFMMIREQILNPEGNRQTQGMIKGMGGGMDDQVLGMIGSQQPVAVSPGEYIIPADVVSGLGDGSSDAGAKELDGLLDRVRQERTNTTKQPKELNKGKVLPK